MPSILNFTGDGSLYLYKATYTLGGWTGDATNGFTQTVTPTAEGNNPPINSNTQFSAPMTKPTGVKATDEALLEALGVINAGSSETTDAGTVVTKVWEKPTAEVVVYWYGNEGRATS